MQPDAGLLVPRGFLDEAKGGRGPLKGPYTKEIILLTGPWGLYSNLWHAYSG